MDNMRSSFSFSSSSSRYKAPLIRKLSNRRAKHQAPVITSVVGTSRNTQMQDEEEEEEARAVSSRITRSRSTAGNFCRALYARAASSQQPTASLKNETWDEVVTTSSVPNRAASYKLYARHISDDSCSDRPQSLPMRSKTTALKPSLISDATPRSKVAKHVHFTFKDNEEISYEVTKDDTQNSWLDMDVSRVIEATANESHDMIVSFGPTGRFTASNMDACKDGKGYMVRIQQSRLINEMLGQRTNLRQSVLEEQARQKREGVVDAEEMCLVAFEHSKWGVELAKSSWWLCRT